MYQFTRCTFLPFSLQSTCPKEDSFYLPSFSTLPAFSQSLTRHHDHCRFLSSIKLGPSYHFCWAFLNLIVGNVFEIINFNLRQHFGVGFSSFQFKGGSYHHWLYRDHWTPGSSLILLTSSLDASVFWAAGPEIEMNWAGLCNPSCFHDHEIILSDNRAHQPHAFLFILKICLRINGVLLQAAIRASWSLHRWAIPSLGALAAQALRRAHFSISQCLMVMEDCISKRRLW